MSHPETARLLAANYARVSRALATTRPRPGVLRGRVGGGAGLGAPLPRDRGHVAALCALELATRPPDPRPRVPIGWSRERRAGQPMTRTNPEPMTRTNPEPCRRCGAAMTAACRPCEREACPSCPCDGCGG